MEHLALDIKNIKKSLIRICKYILGKSINGNKANKIKDLKDIGMAAWGFISFLYKAHWDNLTVDDSKMSFRNKVKSKFSQQIIKEPVNNKGKNLIKPSYVSPLPSPIPAKSPKEMNEISKFFKKNPPSVLKKSYVHVSSSQNMLNIARETLKIKDAFLNLQNRKIEQVQKLISGDNKFKLCIKMTTKGSSRKQVIVPMNTDNIRKYIKDVSTHVININRALKSIKLNIIANFIRLDGKGIVISTNNVTNPSDLQEIGRCVKNSLVVEADQIKFSRLPQSKSYLKIVSIPYLSNQTNTRLSANEVEKILKNNHIFNDIVLVSKPRVIKVSPKSDISIVWINIWDVQSGAKTKRLINRRFNIGNFITTIQGANMNPGMSQCKNCWKWGHTASVCRIQESKCIKCNGSYLSIHHHQFMWCCKANDKINPLRLETKKGELCPYSFKCSNYKGEHQADSTKCPFWKHRFNKECHTKEYAKLWENCKTSTCSVMNDAKI